MAFDCRCDDLAVEAQRIDMRLELAPACEAVIAGDLELRRMQLRLGTAGAHLLEPLLGGLLEPVEIRLRGKRLGHGTPSFEAPGVRVSGWKEDVDDINVEGGFNPSRGPLVACSTGR